ncbi:MAG: hypothetical protein GY906_24510 [bacterium]|nr:hypothetical protein [bacterium]
MIRSELHSSVHASNIRLNGEVAHLIGVHFLLTGVRPTTKNENIDTQFRRYMWIAIGDWKL